MLTALIVTLLVTAFQPDAPDSQARIKPVELEQLGITILNQTGSLPKTEPVLIEKNTLGCMLLIVDFLRTKTSPEQPFTPLVIDSVVLALTSGKEFEIPKARPDIRDVSWQLALKYPRDLNLLWFLETRRTEFMLDYEETKDRFRVSPRPNSRFGQAYNKAFPSTALAASK